MESTKPAPTPTPKIGLGTQEKRWKALYDRVRSLYGERRYSEAVPAAQDALRFAQTSFGPVHPAVASSLFALGSVYHAQGRLEDAEPLYKRSLSIAEKALGPTSPDVGQTLSFLARLRMDQKRYGEAEPLYRRALEIAERVMKPDDRTLASLFSAHADVLRKTGKVAEAEQVEARGRAVRARAEGEGGTSGMQLARPASRTDEVSFDCVLGFLQTSLPTASSTSEASLRVDTLIKLAEVYALGGNRDKAVESLTRARREAEAEAQHPTTPATDARSKALAPDPDARPAAFARGYLAIDAYDEALAFARTITKPHFRAIQLSAIALALAAKGGREKAVGILAESAAALDNSGKDSRGFEDVAAGYARLGDCEEARRIVLSIPDRSAYAKAPALVRVASECAKAGAPEAARRTISDSLRVADLIDKRSAARYETLARAAAVQIDLGGKEGLELLARVLTEVPKPQLNGKLGPVIADVYASARQYEKAKEVASSIESPPSRADALLEIARRYLAAGDKASAGELLDQSFELTLGNRRSDPSARFPRFGEIAVAYARASRADRAKDVLVAALREIRGQYFFEVTFALFDVLRAYGEAGLTPDATARGLIEDLCSGKAFEPTPSEMAKERRATAAAEIFIKRWHQTLDLGVLFDEMYASNPRARERNLKDAYGVYRFWAGVHTGMPFDDDIDETLMRDFFFSFWNFWYLMEEHQLAFREADGSATKPPAFPRQAAVDGNRISRKQVAETVAGLHAALPILRKRFSPVVFRSAAYLENLRRQEQKHERFRIAPGLPAYGIPEDVEVYNVRRGVFDLYLVEENGKLKVLTLGFEL